MEEKQSRIYVGIILGLSFILGILAMISHEGAESGAYQFLQKGFTAFPVITAFVTRRLVKAKNSMHLSLKVWKHVRLWIFSAIGTGLLIAVGAVLYFIVFPRQYSGVFNYGRLAALFGSNIEGQMPIKIFPVFIIISAFIGAVCIPIQLLELGEEIGWRGYLLPMQVKRYGVKKGVLLNGFLWGIAHLPLIYFGFNYSEANIGAPWSNMVMMMLLCMGLGVICSYVTIQSGNCMYAAIIHGVVNVIGEMPVFLSSTMKSGLLGPNPTGFIGMSGLIICAVILFIQLDSKTNPFKD